VLLLLLLLYLHTHLAATRFTSAHSPRPGRL